MTAKDYMNQMYYACSDKLIHDGVYGGRKGHLRLAREIGYALPGFTEKEQYEILAASYSIIYVRACLLKPVLDAKEWIAEMKQGMKKLAKT